MQGVFGYTEKWYARRVRQMQRLPIYAEVLRTTHESAHLFENGGCSRIDLMPCSIQSMYRRRTES